MSAFLRDFDMYFCKLFDGARHDSGDPFQWGERMIAHYVANRVDPRTKTLIFSDSLTVPRTIELYQQFRGRCQLAFGIGTNLTNDLGYEPLQIVIKMVRCNDQPVAKLSDTPSKNMCEDERYLAYLRQVFEIAQPDRMTRFGTRPPRFASPAGRCRTADPAARHWPSPPISTAAACRRCGACRSRASCCRSR